MRLEIPTVVIVENSQSGRWVRIQARSHFSMGVSGLLALIASLSGLTLVLALVATWQGYWPILVIAVFQVVLLGVILVRAWKSAWTVETVTVDPATIAVLQQWYSGSRRLEMDTAWARLILTQPAITWYTPELRLKSGDAEVELGAYLNAAEKMELAEALRAAIETRSAWQHQQIETETR